MKLRVDVVRMYGDRCVCCGEWDIRFLTFDHVNDDGATVRRRERGKRKGGEVIVSWMSKVRQSGRIDRTIRLLCYNCNCARKNFNGVCPHKLSVTVNGPVTGANRK